MIIKKLVAKESKNGQGLFADEYIAKGEKVIIFDGDIISWDEAISRGRENHVVPQSTDSYIDIGKRESLVNHSCNPTTGFLNNNSDTLFALRDINHGEEITFDYSTVTTDGWTMRCKCGEEFCRGNISNFVDLSDEWKKKLQPVTPQWVLDISQ